MNEKTMKTTSKKIENKITLVTSILGLIIVNIIWIAGIGQASEDIQPSFTQNSSKKEIKKADVKKLPISVSLSTASFN